ncbi:MAG: ATP-binding protein [bacterium]|nr:ATP-binding protein [bacterium]
MKLSIKYFLAFLSVSLVPLVVVGLFTFMVAKDQLTSRTINSLESLASVQESRIYDNIDRDIEQINLIASGAQLKFSFQKYVNGADNQDIEDIEKILADANESSETIAEISVIGLDGNVLASTSQDQKGRNVSKEKFFEDGKEKNGIHHFFKGEDEEIYKQLSGPFELDGEVLGVIEIESSAKPLISIIKDFPGLGKTGESILGIRNDSGDAIYLTPLKYAEGAALTRTIDKNDSDIPINSALQGKEQTYNDDETVDYRGESVIAVTKYIDSQDWGLVVKTDKSEAFASVNVILNAYLFVLVATFLLVTFVSILLAREIIKPIKALTNFAEKLQKGALNSRVNTNSIGEIDILSDTLNKMADQVHKSHAELENRVQQRTAELNKTKALDEAMLASIGDGLVVTDMEQKVLMTNKAAEGMMGFSENEITGKVWSEIAGLVTDEGKKPEAKDIPINKVLGKEDSSITSSSDPFNFTRKNGAPFPVAITATKLKVDDKPIGAVIVFRDITKDRSIDRAKTEFVSLASHQLRTPLSAINWYTEMLKDGDLGKLNKEQLKLLDEIYLGNQRMVDLVNSLLNVSRLELGNFTVVPELTDISELSKSVIRELTPKINDKQHKVTQKYAKLPKLNLDPKLTRIIIQNLASNAVKYSPPKSNVEVSINKLKKGQPADGRIASKDSIFIRVTDNGYGIPQKEQKMIFQKMFRAENIRQKNAEGTGLGVYIIKQIVEQCGGEVWFHSKENEGTTFFVMMPLEGMKARGGKSLEDQISVTDLQDDNHDETLTKVEKKPGKVITYNKTPKDKKDEKDEDGIVNPAEKPVKKTKSKSKTTKIKLK